MRKLSMLSFMFVLACANAPAPKLTPAASAQVASPRADCPSGYELATANLTINDLSVHIKACLAAGETLTDVCTREFRDGYSFWNCLEPRTIIPARDEQGNIVIEEAIEPSDHTPEEFDKFYGYLREYLHERPNPHESPAHLRYHAYYVLADELGETPSATLVEDGRSRVLAAEPWFETTVLSDIEHCDANLARAASRVAFHFTRITRKGRCGLTGISRIQRFRDRSLHEEVRLALLHGWLNAVAVMYEDHAKAAKVYGPVLDELEGSDSSLLIRQAVPLYRDMLANSNCCGKIHWPNDRPNPMLQTAPAGATQDPLFKIYEPNEALPLPEPHKWGHNGSCPADPTENPPKPGIKAKRRPPKA